MRDIKFRAWDQATMDHWEPKPQGMVFFFIHNVPNFIDHTFNENKGKWERRFIIEQFTGLQDSNGIDIYEGDILVNYVNQHYWEYVISTLTNSKSNSLYAVETFNNCSTNEEDDTYTFERNSSRWGCRREIEFLGSQIKVIGNIHENQELLEPKR